MVEATKEEGEKAAIWAQAAPSAHCFSSTPCEGPGCPLGTLTNTSGF